MNCQSCGHENPADNRFCGGCGSPLANLCPKCGTENPADHRFCGKCGSSLGATAQAPALKKSDQPQIRIAHTTAPENLEGERKTVTALFADIKGSTELEQDLDPEEARAIVDPALKLMIDAVRRYDGYVVQSTGDGIFAIFGAPVAHEDHPQRALYAALRMHEEMRRYSSKLVADGGNPLQCRVGVNTGEVVVRSISTGGKAEYTPIGHTANLASRMQAVAPVGSVAVAEPTRKLCEGYFSLRAMGPTKVKGVAELVDVYEVIGLGPLRTRLQRSAGRGLTKFVGRDREMEAMKHASELAKAGRGQIVAAVAEAGTGKSRLFFEFKAKNQSGWMVLEAFSVSHGKASAYLPILDLLYSYFDIKSEDDARKRREKVNGRIVTLDPALEDTRPYLFALLGIAEGEDSLVQMDADIRKRRTLDAIKRILLRESLNQPLMVIFEDLHWIDEQTQEFLSQLADSIANAKILLLVNYRPQYRHEWGSKTYYTQLRLDPLGRESADEMLAALLGDNPELAPLKRVIIERTEGNPFFMEETVQVLLDEGALVRNGAMHLTRPIAELKIPPTVQGILAARIDRLPADVKDLLQTLSVIGRDLPMSLICAVFTKSEGDLDRMLNDLQLSEFIYEQPAVGDVEYAFKHALTQEVAYNSVLQERRKTLHERIGAALEEFHASSLDDHLAELAHHYGRSNNSEKAVEYLYKAGEQASMRNALGEAEAMLRQAIRIVSTMPDTPARDEREFDLQSAYWQVILYGRGVFHDHAAPTIARLQELAEKIGTDRDLLRSLRAAWALKALRGDWTSAAEVTERMMAAAGRSDSSYGLTLANFDSGLVALPRGQLALAKQHFEAVPTSYNESDWKGSLLQPSAQALASLGTALWHLGFADQARLRFREGIAEAERLNSATAIIYALNHAGQFHLQAGEIDNFRPTISSLAAHVEVSQLALTFGGKLMIGWLLVLDGRTAEGIAAMRDAIEGPGNAFISRHLWARLVSEAYLRTGKTEEAHRVIEDAISTAAENLLDKPEAIRFRGEMRLGTGAVSQAETDFRDSIGMARQFGSKAYELRATTSLARLLRDTSRRDEARAMLADIYGWFTEGFDTADLKDARALLDELGAG